MPGAGRPRSKKVHRAGCLRYRNVPRAASPELPSCTKGLHQDLNQAICIRHKKDLNQALRLTLSSPGLVLFLFIHCSHPCSLLFGMFGFDSGLLISAAIEPSHLFSESFLFYFPNPLIGSRVRIPLVVNLARWRINVPGGGSFG